jgi:hypothetical protein
MGVGYARAEPSPKTTMRSTRTVAYATIMQVRKIASGVKSVYLLARRGRRHTKKMTMFTSSCLARALIPECSKHSSTRMEGRRPNAKQAIRSRYITLAHTWPGSRANDSSWWKEEEGFAVTARFRLNTQDLLQLQELSERRREGYAVKKASFVRKSRSTHRRLNEFTHFLQGTTSREPEIQAPPQQRLNPAQSGRHRAERTVSDTRRLESQYTNDRREHRGSSVAELTLAASRVSISDRSRHDVAAASIATRQSNEDDASMASTHGSMDGTSQHDYGPYIEDSATEPRRHETSTQRRNYQDEFSPPRTILQQRTADQHNISDRHSRDTVLVQAELGQRKVQQGNQPESPQHATVQPARTHADSTRRDVTYRKRLSASGGKQNDGRSVYVSSNPAPFEQKASGRPARNVSDDEDADVVGHRTALSSTVVREPLYHDRHSIPSKQQRERRDSYSSPVSSLARQQAVQRATKEESDFEDSTAVDPKRKQTKSYRHDPARSDRHSNPTGKQPREPEKTSKPAPKTQARRKSTKQADDSDTDSEGATDIPRIKFFVPSEGLDLTVLAFYVRLCVDSSATVKPTNLKGKDGFVLEAKRAVTIDELSDMKRDTKEWLSEKRGLSSRDSYVGSETAKQRRKRAARKT